MKVLMFEDEKSLYDMYSTEFEVRGMEVALNDTGSDPIKTIKKEKPDIILLDLMLPEESGLSILKKIKEDPEVKNIPVAMLTNFGNEENVKKAMDLGAEEFIVKYNIVPSEVADKIENMLGEGKGGVPIKE